MTFIEVFETAKNWLAENWTDLGVALLTICNASSFVVKKIFNWRSKKNDVQETSSQSQEGQEDISQNFAECEVNQCNAESDERRNQTLKFTGLNGFDDFSKQQPNQVDSIAVHSVEESSVEESPVAVSLTKLSDSQLLYKVKSVLSKTEMSNDSKIEVLKFILEVE